MSNVDVHADIDAILDPRQAIRLAEKKSKKKEIEEDKELEEIEEQSVVRDQLDKGQEVHLSPQAAKLLGKAAKK